MFFDFQFQTSKQRAQGGAWYFQSFGGCFIPHPFNNREEKNFPA
jgi:hypothetical protein